MDNLRSNIIGYGVDSYDKITSIDSKLGFLPINTGLSFHVFDFDDSSQVPSVDRLDPSLVINGISVLPTFRYKGGDATTSAWTKWTYGEDLAIAGSGSDVLINQGSPLLGSNDDSVKFQAGKNYESTTSIGDIGTNDLVLEAILKFNAGGTRAIISADGEASTIGWLLYESTGPYLRFRLLKDATIINLTSGILSVGCWYHIMWFVNRNENSNDGGNLYINGVYNAEVNYFGLSGVDISSSGTLNLGARSDDSIPTDSNIAYCAMWKQSDWHKAGADGPTEWATIAAERFAKLTGFYPKKSKGTAIATTKTRSSNAFVDKLEYTGTQGTELIVDNDMEAAGTSAWTTYASATLSKDTSIKYNGSQSIKCSYNGLVNPGCSQAIVTIGKIYKISGYAKVDNASYRPQVADGSSIKWSGNFSTEWQNFSFNCFPATNTIYFYSNITGSGSVYYDELSVTELPDRKIYQVGAEWLRVAKRYDSTGTIMSGYLGEKEGHNHFTYSEDFSNAAWVKTRISSIDTTNGDTAPDKVGKFHGIIADTNNNTHSVGQSIAGLAAPHCFSVFAKKGNKDWIYINVPTVANANAYFNIFTGTLGTVGAGCTARIAPFGDGVFRCVIIYTGGVPSHSHDIYPAESNGDHSFAGDGSTVNVWLWGSQHEDEGQTTPLSYIPTTTAAVTRLKDQLIYSGGDNVGGEDRQKGSMQCDILLPNYDLISQNCLLSISDGGSAGDRNELNATTVGDRLYHYMDSVEGTSIAASADNIASQDLADGEKHTCIANFTVGDQHVYMDGTKGANTNTPTIDQIPKGVDTLVVAYGTTASSEIINGIISNIKIYDKPKPQ